MNLTIPQRRALDFCLEVSMNRDLTGAHLHHVTARALLRMGLVVGVGAVECDSDSCELAGEHPHVGSAYAITDEGRRVASQTSTREIAQ